MKGKEIREQRISLGLTQGDLASKLDVSQSLVSQWEKGKQTPNPTHQENLESILGTKEDRGSALGAWLTSSRLAKKMSVPELAKESGVSAPAIYRIESGKTENIQRKTRKKLEKALGSQLSEEAVEEISEESKIEGVGIGSLQDFDPHDDADRPTKAGIYVLYDISERPIYVGQGSSVKKRIRDHEDKFWFKRPIVESASWVEVADGTLRKQVESVLIKFLKSNAVINKQNVERKSR